jgi:hypothetical protein
MSTNAKKWLADRAAPPGMLAGGMRRPDGNLICQTLDESYPVGKMEKILGQFEGLHAEWSASQPVPRWSTWTFEQGQIRFVARPDGWVLGLVSRMDSAAQPQLDPLSQEFLSLPLDG